MSESTDQTGRDITVLIADSALPLETVRALAAEERHA